MDAWSISRRYLSGNPAAARELETFARTIEGQGSTVLVARARALLGRASSFMETIREQLEPVVPPSIAFSCNHCGKCCDTFTIGVSTADILRYIDTSNDWLLPFISLSDDRPSFRLMNVAQFQQVALVYPSSVIERCKAINPFLDRATTRDGGTCMFHDKNASRCTIHDLRPLECRLYPLANVMVSEENVLCDASTMTHGSIDDSNGFTSDYDAKRVTDVSFVALYNLNPFGGWRCTVFQLASIFHELAHALVF